MTSIPAGILQPPFYSNHLDDAVNYGAHRRGDRPRVDARLRRRGRQFDAKGNLHDWWTPQDAKEFDTRAQCIGQEYSQFTAVDDVKVNGQLTMGENVADSGGVRLAMMSLTRCWVARPGKDRRVYAGSAILHRLRPDLVPEHAAGRSAHAGHRGSSFATSISRQRRAIEQSGIPQSVRV